MRTDRITVDCTQGNYETIAASVNKARKGTKEVKVSRDALAALLIDHGRLHAVVRSLGVRIQEKNPE